MKKVKKRGGGVKLCRNILKQPNLRINQRKYEKKSIKRKGRGPIISEFTKTNKNRSELFGIINGSKDFASR